MSLSTKKIITSLISMSLFLNLIFGIYIVQEKNENKEQIGIYKEEINDLKQELEFYEKEYKKYYEFSEELQNQMGIYYYI